MKPRERFSKRPICPKLRAVLLGSFFSVAVLFYGPGNSGEVVRESGLKVNAGDEICPWCDSGAVAT